MNTVKEPSFEWINRDIKIVLAELDELVGIKSVQLDSKQIEKNNKVIIQLLDKLSEFKPIIKSIKK